MYKISVSILAKGISEVCNILLFVLQQHQKAVDLYATSTLEIFYMHLKDIEGNILLQMSVNGKVKYISHLLENLAFLLKKKVSLVPRD
jgi:hypothetical protein